MAGDQVFLWTDGHMKPSLVFCLSLYQVRSESHRMFEKMISRLAWLEPRNSLNIHSFVALSCIFKEKTSLDKSGRRAVFRSLIK